MEKVLFQLEHYPTSYCCSGCAISLLKFSLLLTTREQVVSKFEATE